VPFNLHPSGFCSWSADRSRQNLLVGKPCPECKRIAGHAPTCPRFKYEDRLATSSRGKLFDCVSILWAKNADKSFITFTLPSLQEGTYQRAATCEQTGDIVIGQCFSKTLEAWKVKEKRKGKALSYVWVAEAQMKRQEKFGGIGDIHYHLIVNRKLKNENNTFSDRQTFNWLQENWCKQIKAEANNCVHVDPVPDYANSIPAYLSKYLGKGNQRPILSRKFQATQDLTHFKPIKLHSFPEGLTMHSESVYTTPEGFDIVTRYFNTREVLEMYAHLMHDEFNFTGNQGNGKSLTRHAQQMDRIKAKLVYA